MVAFARVDQQIDQAHFIEGNAGPHGALSSLAELRAGEKLAVAKALKEFSAKEALHHKTAPHKKGEDESSPFC